MITIKATHKTKDVLIGIDDIKKKHQTGLGLALHDIGTQVVSKTKHLIETGKKTGRMYGKHQASAPGEAPANRTGRLANSGDYQVRNWQEMTVGETAEYAGYLEEGTRGREGADGKRVGKIKPRKHLLRAINSLARNTQQAILENVKGEL